MDKLIDFHTHHYKPNHTNIISYDVAKFSEVKNDYFTIGIHPWWIQEQKIKQLEELLITQYNKSTFFGLGEMGLDKIRNKQKYQKQQEVFEAQLNLALKYKIKTIILHNVKSHSDTLRILKQTGFNNNIILHDYHGNEETLNQYAKLCHIYPSFKANFICHNSKSSMLTQIPFDSILIETDDDLSVSLEKGYEALAKLFNLSTDKVVQSMYSKFRKLKQN